jgi:hypothetical protein
MSSDAAYTICGHPAWSDAACQRCDACRECRAQLHRTLSAAQTVVACWENDRAMLDEAIPKLRDALDFKQEG